MVAHGLARSLPVATFDHAICCIHLRCSSPYSYPGSSNYLDPSDTDKDVKCGLAPASAETLHSLCVDSTADVFTTVYYQRIQGVYVYNIPDLSALYMQCKKVIEYSLMERCPRSRQSRSCAPCRST